MTVQVKGLVIRTVDVKESDRLITIFTEEMGIVSAMAKGARSLKSRQMSSTMQFCYGNFLLYKKGDYYWIKEAELVESFFGLRDSIEGLALAAYIAEFLNFVTVAEAERDLLRLALNSLYAISTGDYSLDKIKAAFEIRAASIIGFMPNVLSCAECDERSGEFYFEIMSGSLRCYSCAQKRAEASSDLDFREGNAVCILTEGAKTALGYCIHSPLERIFSFRISDEDMYLLARATEEYALNQLGQTFKTLEFYKEVKR